jgi:hypothetical protein
MKLLITCFILDLSGSSTYTLTLARALRNRGVEVDVITQLGGVLAGELRKVGIPVYDRLRDIAGETYTCIIGQHNSVVKAVRLVKPNVPMVFISHGILPRLEHPPSCDTNIQRYIAVSEEVKNDMISSYSVPPDRVDVLRNFVDVERFRPQREINDRPGNVLFVSNGYTPEVQATITGTCERLGLGLSVVGKKNQAQNVEAYINRADIVISLGRGIIEAMACGRAAVVYDYLGGDGMITRENIEEIRKHNFSGRRFRKKYGVEELTGEIGKYDKAMGVINRDIVMRDHNASLAVERILSICGQAEEAFCPIRVSRVSVVWGDPLWRYRIINRTFPPNGRAKRFAKYPHRLLTKIASSARAYLCRWISVVQIRRGRR